MKKLIISALLILVGSCLFTSCCCCPTSPQKNAPSPNETTVPRDNK